MNGDASPTQLTPEAFFAGRYALSGAIGRGAMGSVDRAIDRVLHRSVAIKRILPNMVSDARRARLLREARAVAALNHPNVVAVYDVGEADGVDFIVMELVDGGTLEERMASGQRPTIDQALDWLEDVADALACAHRAGLVHRDIKPPNLLLSKDGRIKIVDFGVVKEIEKRQDVPAEAFTMKPEKPLTAMGHIVGTPKYMAPEQLRAEKVDARTDEYAWGLVAYTLLTGIHPYDASPQSITMQFLADGKFVPPPFAGRVGGVAPEIEAVVKRTLAAEPRDRFPDMVAVKDALVGARRARPLTNVGTVSPMMMPAAPAAASPIAATTTATTTAEHLERVAPTAPDHPPLGPTIGQANLPTLPSANVQTLDEQSARPVVVMAPPPTLASADRRSSYESPPVTPMAPRISGPPAQYPSRTSMPLPEDPGRKILGIGAAIFGAIASILILIALAIVFLLNRSAGGQERANARIDELDRQISTRSLDRSLDRDTACALAEIHLLKNGYNEHTGHLLKNFACNGVVTSATTVPMLSRFHFEWGSSEKYDRNVCFKRNAGRWTVSDIRIDACVGSGSGNESDPAPPTTVVPPLTVAPLPTPVSTHVPVPQPTTTNDVFGPRPVPTSKPTPTTPPTPTPTVTIPKPVPTAEPAACAIARKYRLEGKSAPIIAAYERECVRQGGTIVAPKPHEPGY